MILCIAEKPSVARDIASILGATKRVAKGGVGYLEGNGYRVTWTFGHLCTLKEPHDYTPSWKAWSLATLPMIPERFGIKPIDIPNYQEQLRTITQLVEQATMVVNCGDAGQEGELIQRWVLQLAGCKVPIKRLWISSLTDEAIREGFNQLKDSEEYQSLYEAGLARAIGDWLLGMNATRLYTIKYARERGKVLSIGRVQTPTLALIVARQKEIEHFIPEVYWELKTLYRETLFSAEKGKYNNLEDAKQALEYVKEKPFTITSVKKKAGKEFPPRLFDLTSLQVACNRKFGMTAEKTLSIAQSLYEKKVLTYPRVDTTYLSDDIYSKARTILLGLVTYRDLTTPLLTESKLRKSKKVFDNSKITDHHAIIPTGQPLHGLSNEEQKVFDLVTRHFIASFYPECEISTTTVLGKVEQEKFRTSGREILKPGWRMVFSGDSTIDEADKESEEKSSSRILPSFTEGESGRHLPKTKEKQTQPPKFYTEATLLRAMETAGKLVEDDNLREAMKENGIGRPSTRANIIETLFKRGYIIKEKRSALKATETGIQLISTISNELLKSAELTGQWEYKLRQIERKELATADFLSELKQLVYSLTQEILNGGQGPSSPHSTSSETIPTPPLCPLCGRGYVIRGRNSYGCSAYREGCTYRRSFEEQDQS